MLDTTPRPEAQGMPFGDHLEDLRRRLLMALLGVVPTTALTLWYGKTIVAWLCQPLMHAQQAAHLPPQAHTFSPIAGFAVYLKVSLVSALIIASPWAVYQLWRFFETGLYPRERRAVLLLAPFSALMTTLGVLFMYYIMLPVCLWFLISFATSFPVATAGESWIVPTDHPTHMAPSVPTPNPQTDTDRHGPAIIPVVTDNPPTTVEGQMWFKLPQGELRARVDGQTRVIPLRTTTLINPLIEIGQYISFVTVMAIGIVVAFQLPVFMLILGWWGLIDPRLIAQYRRYCVLVCFAAGMLLTPSDILSMILLAVPLWGLFELGLLLMRATYPKDAGGAAS